MRSLIFIKLNKINKIRSRNRSFGTRSGPHFGTQNFSRKTPANRDWQCFQPRMLH